MIITHLAVEGVGRFRGRHVVHGLGPGLNLLCAPNEAGKSTVARALRACMFFRHTSTAEEVRALACSGAQLPALVEVGFQGGDAEHTIHKCFLASPNSKLFRQGELFAEGRAADEALWSTLGIAAEARGVDESTFGLLWVQQGESWGAFEATDDARSALTKVIEAEVGQVLGGARGERVFENVVSQLATEQTTKNGAPKAGGRWKEAKDRLEATRIKLGSAEATLAQLETDMNLLAARTEARGRLSDPALIAALRAELQAGTDSLATADRKQSEAQIAEGDAERLGLAAELAETRHRELVERDDRIAATRKRLADIAGKIAARESAREALARRAEDAAVEDADLTARLKSVEEAWRRFEQIADAIADVARLDKLKSRLTHAQTIRRSLAALDAAMAERGISADAMQQIESRAREFSEKLAYLEAKAPRLKICLAPGADRRVRLRGDVLDASIETPITQAVQIDVDGIAAIEIIPVAVTVDVQGEEKARRALDNALRAAGALTLSDARERRNRAEEAEVERRGLVAELQMVAPDENGVDGITLLEAALTAIETNLDSMKDHLTGPLPSVAELAKRRFDAEGMREACRQKCMDAHDLLGAAQHELKVQEQSLDTLREQRAGEETTLREQLEQHPDAQRAIDMPALSTAAVETHGVAMLAKLAAEKARAAVPTQVERTAIEAGAAKCQHAMKTHAAELDRAERDIIALRERIAAHGGEGLGERKAELDDELALEERDLARVERRLAALRLLLETIEQCRDEARDAFLAPIKRAMRPYLHSLFPNADLDLAETLSIEGLRRGDGGETPEPFDALSLGTREQIAVIVRLALGSLLAERGQSVPILLDDALVFSDDERIERMFDALKLAAEKQQVIIFTCRTRAFQSMGGRRLRIEPEGVKQSS